MPNEPPSGAAPASESGGEIVRTANANLASDAAAHLRGSGCTIQGFRGDSQEIRRQADLLIKWARERGVVLPSTCTDGLRAQPTGSAEHTVFHRASDNRAVKCTIAGSFGVTPDPKGEQQAATPLFYLTRILLTNRVFPESDLRVEGIMIVPSRILFENETASIVISQPWISAANTGAPNPSPKQIEEFM